MRLSTQMGKLQESSGVTAMLLSQPELREHSHMNSKSERRLKPQLRPVHTNVDSIIGLVKVTLLINVTVSANPTISAQLNWARRSFLPRV